MRACLGCDRMCHSEVVSDPAFDLSKTYVHLGLGARAVAIPDFEWTAEFLDRYVADHASDGEEGRLVMIGASDSTWTSWERHPAGEELVAVIAGRITLVQEVDGAERRIASRTRGGNDQPTRGLAHHRCSRAWPGPVRDSRDRDRAPPQVRRA